MVGLAEGLDLKTATTKTIVTALAIEDDVDVVFLLSVPNTLKEMLLKSARLLLYTPSNEHFGIVPLEAMLAGVPVLAANTGGPLETVVEGKTGWLCPPNDVESWTAVMDRVLHRMSDAQLKTMSQAGIHRVQNEFSDVKMAERLDLIIDGMAKAKRKNSPVLKSLMWSFTLMLVDIAYWYASQDKQEKKLAKILPPPGVLTFVLVVCWIGFFALKVSTSATTEKDLGKLAQKKSR